MAYDMLPVTTVLPLFIAFPSVSHIHAKPPSIIVHKTAYQPMQVVLSLEAGAVCIYLPNEIRPGDKVSGSVFGNPAGESWDQKQQNMQYLNSLTFKAGTSKIAVGTTSFSFVAPPEPAVPLEVDDPTGKVVGMADLLLTVSEADRPSDFSAPYVVQAGMPFGIHGPFDGDRSRTFASFDDHAAGVLAEGSSECYLTSPNDHPGTVQLTVQKSGHKFERKLNVVGFTFMTPSERLLAGAKSTLGVEIDGLRDADPAAFPVLVTLFIDNPKVLRFSGSSPEAYTLAVNPSDIVNGHVLKSVPVIARSRGMYSVTGSISDSSVGRQVALKN